MAYYRFVAERTSPETVPGEPPGTALFEQVEREPKLSDKVAEMMLETILSRRLEAGARLPSERELGEQFGVSRTVVREAVRALAAKGVIEVRSGSGLRVASVGPATVNESMSLYLRGGQIEFEKVHEVRSMLEVHIAGLAAERAADEDVATLAAVEAQMEAAIGDADAAARARPRVPPSDRAGDPQRPLPRADGLDRHAPISTSGARTSAAATAALQPSSNTGRSWQPSATAIRSRHAPR